MLARETTVLTFVLSALVYGLTLCPTVYVEGSGELIGAVSMLGTPHPTGYPLFCLLGRLVVVALPMGNAALEVNVASALTCAMAASALSAFLHGRGVHALTAVGSALVFAFSATFWSQAVVAEVYGLSMLAAVVMLAVWTKAFAYPQQERWLVVAAFCTGLAASTHLSQLLLLPGIGLLGLRRWRSSTTAARSSAAQQSIFSTIEAGRWATAGKMLGAACTGYSVVLYLPLRSGRGSGFHWSSLDTPAALWDHLTATLYRSSFYGMPLEGALTNVSRFAQQMATEFPPLLLAPMGWGLWVALRRDPAVTWMVGCAAAANLLTALNYHRDPNGLDVFFLQAILSGVVFLGYGVDDLASRIRCRLHVSRRAVAGLVAALMVLGVITGNHRQADRSDSREAHRYGMDILQSLPPSATLMSEGDDASFILDYLQRVEGVRPDVTLHNRNGLGSGPTLMSIHAPRLRARLRRAAERDLVLASASGGPPLFSVFARAMPVEDGFEFVPHGLVYRVAASDRGLEPTYPIDMANAATDLKIDGDPWVRKIQANYWYMQGEHEAQSGWSETAKAAYARAGEIAHSSRTMQSNIARILFLNNELEEALDYVMRAIEIDSMWPRSYSLAVRILTRLGRLDEARALNKRAAKLSRFS